MTVRPIILAAGVGKRMRSSLPKVLHRICGRPMIRYGDVPLLTGRTLERLVAHYRDARPGITLLTASLPEPVGYGRIVRGAGGTVARIVEEADASPDERAIREINAGTYVFDGALLREGLRHVQPTNAQGEYYLTDVIAWTLSRGAREDALPVDDPVEVLGVNSRRDLARAEAAMRERLLARLGPAAHRARLRDRPERPPGGCHDR